MSVRLALGSNSFFSGKEKQMETHNWITQTEAGDIMVRDVVTLQPYQTLDQATGVLLREQISGAPVVDELGACVGVFSVSDILLAEEKVATQQQKIAESSFWNSNLSLPSSVYANKMAEVRDKMAPVAQQPVERFMTSDLVSVSENTSLERVVQSMVDAHVHRVLVLDAEGRLQGIISTSDVLAALLRESQQPVSVE
jgi:CBS domain-containing protein